VKSVEVCNTQQKILSLATSFLVLEDIFLKTSREIIGPVVIGGHRFFAHRKDSAGRSPVGLSS
jgi:hypothetical protein